MRWFVPLGVIVAIASSSGGWIFKSDPISLECHCVHYTCSTNDCWSWHNHGEFGQIHGCDNASTVSFQHEERRWNFRDCVSMQLEDSQGRSQSVLHHLAGWSPYDSFTGPYIPGVYPSGLACHVQQCISYGSQANGYTGQQCIHAGFNLLAPPSRWFKGLSQTSHSGMLPRVHR